MEACVVWCGVTYLRVSLDDGQSASSVRFLGVGPEKVLLFGSFGRRIGRQLTGGNAIGRGSGLALGRLRHG